VNSNFEYREFKNDSIIVKNGKPVESTDYWGDVGKIMNEKDNKIEELARIF